MGVSYKKSGVDLEAAEASIKKIAVLAQSTFNKNVLKGIGLFAGFQRAHPFGHAQGVRAVDGPGRDGFRGAVTAP